MIKKIVSASTVLAVMASVTAHAASYVGGSLGFQDYHSTKKPIVSVFLGVGTSLGETERFYLGSELTANLTNYSSFKGIYRYGLSVIPGYMINHTILAYLRGGVSTDKANSSFKYSNNTSNYGGGLSINVFKGLDLRGEYVHYTAAKTGFYNLGLLYRF